MELFIENLIYKKCIKLVNFRRNEHVVSITKGHIRVREINGEKPGPMIHRNESRLLKLISTTNMIYLGRRSPEDK